MRNVLGTIDLTNLSYLTTIRAYKWFCKLKLPSSVLYFYCEETFGVEFSEDSELTEVVFAMNYLECDWGATLKSLNNCTSVSILSFYHITYQEDNDELQSALSNLTAVQVSSFSYEPYESRNVTIDLTNVWSLKGLEKININYAYYLLGTTISTNLLNITDLTLTNCNLSSLDFVELIPNLTNLNLSNNSIQDLKVLNNLINLQTLYLTNNCIFDKAPNKDDEGNIVYNLKIIANLKNNYSLTKVFLSGNEGITDWSPVSSINGWNSSSYSGW